MISGCPTASRSGEGSHWDITPADEPRLDRDCGFLAPGDQAQLRDWWLAVKGGANTPNWDLASTCRVEGKRGLLLVEAKAHTRELSDAGHRREEQMQPQEHKGGHPDGQRCAGEHHAGGLEFVEGPPLPGRQSICVVLEARFAGDSRWSSCIWDFCALRKCGQRTIASSPIMRIGWMRSGRTPVASSMKPVGRRVLTLTERL